MVLPSQGQEAHILAEETKNDHSEAKRRVPLCRGPYKTPHEYKLKKVIALNSLGKEFCKPCLQHMMEEKLKLALKVSTDKFS